MITKIVRLKILKPIFPTEDWKEFRQIIKELQEETRVASNRIMTQANIFYSQSLEGFDLKENRKMIQNTLYRIATINAPSLQTKNANAISREIYANYFTGKNSYIRGMEKGDRNPPMGFSKTIPIPIADTIHVVPTEQGHNIEFALVSKNFKAKWNEGREKTDPFYMRTGMFTVAVSSRDGSVKSILERCIAGTYKICGSKLVTKTQGGKSDYFIHLTYAQEVKNEIELYKEKICGVDIGITCPAVAAVNFNTYSRMYIKDREIIRQKMKIDRQLSYAKAGATFDGNNGHGRKTKCTFTNKYRAKAGNLAKTKNSQWAKAIVDFAVKNQCGTIHIEELTGFNARNSEDDFLKRWTYYQLQDRIECKAAEYGIEVKKVPARHTSQRCSKCGHIERGNRPKGKMGQSYFKCLECGHEENADFNAAKNIARYFEWG